MIKLGQREFAIPLCLWAALPFAFAAYAAAGLAWTLQSGASDLQDAAGNYLQVLIRLGVASLAGFLLADIARRSTMPWYALPLVIVVSLAMASLAGIWIAKSAEWTAIAVIGLALAGLASPSTNQPSVLPWVALAIVPAILGTALALAVTLCARVLSGLPWRFRETRQEFWANLGGTFAWLALGLAGYSLLRAWVPTQAEPPVTAAWYVPLAAGGIVAALAITLHLYLAHRFRRRHPAPGGRAPVWLLAILCIAALALQPGLIGLR